MERADTTALLPHVFGELPEQAEEQRQSDHTILIMARNLRRGRLRQAVLE
jgi:hypothetical protein